MESPEDSENEFKDGEHNIGNEQHKHCATTFKSTKSEFLEIDTEPETKQEPSTEDPVKHKIHEGNKSNKRTLETDTTFVLYYYSYSLVLLLFLYYLRYRGV